MHKFPDNTGQEWPIEIDGLAVKRVRTLLGFDLMTIVENEGRTLLELLDDPIMLGDVVYCLLQPQLDKAGISDEQFGPRLKGDALDAAWEAVLLELIDFFPKGRRRLLLTAALQAGLVATIDVDQKMRLLCGEQQPPTSGERSTA